MIPVPLAPGLHRPPEVLVVGVVVDQDDLVARVVQAEQGAQRFDDHVRRLVVRRDVQADHGELAVRHGQPGPARDAAAPVLGTQRVAEFPKIGAAQHGGEYLEQPEQHAAHGADRPEVAVEGPLDRVDQVHHEQEHGRGPAQVSAGRPAPGHRQPDQAGGHHARHPGHQVVLGRPEQPQGEGHRRGQQRRADHGEQEAPHGRPRPGAAVDEPRGREQGRRAERRGNEGSQQDRLKHEGPLTGAPGRIASGFGRYPGQDGSIMAARTVARSAQIKKGSALGL